MEILINILGIIGLMLLIGLLSALPIMWLWNWLMPDLFKLVEITFLQAFGLSILCRMILGTSSSHNSDK